MVRQLPDFVIIGSMKCGTSSLHDQLDARRAFFMSDPKEPNFFSDDANWKRGLEWYCTLFEGARDDQLRGESSTHYTKLPTYPETVARMRRHLPNARLLYIMRHPIERIVSQYIHEWTEREVTQDLPDAIRRHSRYSDYSCYARQLAPFLEQWGCEHLLPVFFEQLVARPDEELQRICRFLGDPRSEDARWKEDTARKNISSERLRRSRTRDLLLGVPPIRALKDALPAVWRERIKGYWQMRRRPEIPSGLLRELEEFVDRDLEYLSMWLGRPLSCARWHELAREPPPSWTPDAPGCAR